MAVAEEVVVAAEVAAEVVVVAAEAPGGSASWTPGSL